MINFFRENKDGDLVKTNEVVDLLCGIQHCDKCKECLKCAANDDCDIGSTKAHAYLIKSGYIRD